MRILLAGHWFYDFYERACANALMELGIDVLGFPFHRYFNGLFGKAQMKWVLPGPNVHRLNRDLLAAAADFQPDVVFVWRGTHIFPETLAAIRGATRAALVSYNNDDPFSPLYRTGTRHFQRLWKYFHQCIPEYDLHFVFRPRNVQEMRSAGAREAYVLLPYYIPSLHYPVALTEGDQARFKCEAVFVGHYEDDIRLECLRALVAAGVQVRLFGPKSWTKRVLGPLSAYFGEIHELRGTDYAKAICGADLALSFHSRLNRDTYTIRSFEIPACGTLLMSERTDDMLTFYSEGSEAVYFSSPGELVDQVLALRADPRRHQAIAAAGHARVLRDRHSVHDRMRELLEIVVRFVN